MQDRAVKWAIAAAVVMLGVGASAQDAPPSRYCDLHHKPVLGEVVQEIVVTGVLDKNVKVDRAHVTTATEAVEALLLREALADIMTDIPAIKSRAAEEQSRLTADRRIRDEARRRHVAVTPAEIDTALARLERASGNPRGELKARLAPDHLYELLRRKIEAASLDAKLHAHPFAFPYRISPPPPCPL
jgi:hypothetical protein